MTASFASRINNEEGPKENGNLIYRIYITNTGYCLPYRGIDLDEPSEEEPVSSDYITSDYEDYIFSAFPCELNFRSRKHGRSGSVRPTIGSTKTLRRVKSHNRQTGKNSPDTQKDKNTRLLENCSSNKELRIKEKILENGKRKRENVRKVILSGSAADAIKEKSSVSKTSRCHEKSLKKSTKEATNPASFFDNSEFVLGSTDGAKFEDETLITLLMELQHREITPEDYDVLVRLDSFVKPNTLSAAQIDSLGSDTVAYVTRDLCLICMDEYSVGDVRNILPCGHLFHRHCITTWLGTTSDKCPIDGSEVR